MASSQKDSRGKLRSKYQVFNTEDSMTVQSDANEADIQFILGKYKAGLTVEGLNKAEAMFLDVSEMDDYTDVMRQSAFAEGEFMKLPSKVREIFHHDVAEWLDAAHDKEKRDELVATNKIKPEDNTVQSAGSGDDTPTATPGPPGAAEVVQQVGGSSPE